MAEQSDQRAIAKASREFVREVGKARAARESVAPEVVASFLAKAGGSQAYGELLYEDFQRARGVGLSEEELAEFEPRPQVVQRYHQMLLGTIQRNDDFSVNNSLWENVDVEDVRAEAKDVVLHFLRVDSEFRHEVFALLRQDEGLLNEFMGVKACIEVTP